MRSCSSQLSLSLAQACAICSLLEQSQFQAFRYLSICDVSLRFFLVTTKHFQHRPSDTTGNQHNYRSGKGNTRVVTDRMGNCENEHSDALYCFDEYRAARLTGGTIRIGPNK
jgi:hypothetical protein